MTLREGAAHREVQRIVKEHVDLVVDAIKLFASAFKKAHLRRIAIEHFTNNTHLGIVAFDRGHPVAPEGARHIRPSILTYTVHATHPNPPQRVLNDVARNLGVVLIEIGQNVDEPAVECRTLKLGRCIRVSDRPRLPAVVGVLLDGAMKPCWRWWVGRPRVIRAGVIGDHIENDFYPLRVRGIHQLLELRQSADVFVDIIKIDRAITVIVGDSLAIVLLFFVQLVGVVVQRVEPDRGDAKRFEVGQLLLHACKVAAVVVASLVAIEHPLRCTVVVARVTIGEPIGHDAIDGIVNAKALKATGRWQRWRNGERHRRTPTHSLERERIAACRRTLRNVHVHKCVRAVRTKARAGALHFRTDKRRPTQMLAVNE